MVNMQDRIEAMARVFMRRELKAKGIKITLSDKEQHNTETLMRFYYAAKIKQKEAI